jgi:TldD protein
MISKNLAHKILTLATETGADFAEIYLEETLSSNLSSENGQIETSSSSISYGAGIRLLKKLQSVYGYTNDISTKGLSKLATSLSKSFKDSRVIDVSPIKKVRVVNKHPIKKPLQLIDKKDKIELMKRANKIIAEYDSRIVRIQVMFMENTKNVTIFNTEGRQFNDVRPRGRIYLLALAAENGKIETSGEGPGAQSGFEYFTEEINIDELALNVAKTAILMLSAKDCPSGKMPVVIGNGFGGVIFHEACGHALEATSVAKKISVFTDKLGQQIANPIVTAIDDGTIPNGWGSNNIDDEGVFTRKNVLIKNGILTSYLVDSFNGRRMNMAGNGASRRQSYRYEPTSRMSNTYIDKGKHKPEEIIAATKFGLYAKSMGGGSVNPATGDFNFAVSEAYIIRNGKIAEPVKGASLIGNGADILMKIDMIADDLKRAQGMCGSVSGYVPVDVGQPTIRVSEITVGGQGGKL